MKTKIKHSNRKWHNWLVYVSLHKILRANKELYTGCVYDLGCGAGHYRAFFGRFATKYIGVDWSNTPHQLTADIIADLNGLLPISDAQADFIISISVLEHLREPQTMLNEAFRILKPSGKIMLQVPWQWPVHEAPYDFFRYSPYGLTMLFERAGFTDVAVKPTGGSFSTLALKFNYLLLRLIDLPKPIRAILKVFCIPFWTIGQILAPILDKLDRQWLVDAPGFYVIASKKA